MNDDELAKVEVPATAAGLCEENVARIVVGSKVRLIGTDSMGEVVTLNARTAVVSLGQMLTTVNVSRLESVSASDYRKATRVGSSRALVSDAAKEINVRRLNFSARIDIRGYRGEEAISAVQQLIDDACIVGQKQVSILHGKGNGVLRERIRTALRGMPIVESYGDAAEDLGGAGITEVTLS